MIVKVTLSDEEIIHDIREHNLQHEELLACYPEKWTQLVKSIVD